MMGGRKRFMAALGGITLLSFIANFAAFIACYNHLATPYLNEGQREINARFIISGGVGLFAAIALSTGIVAYVALSTLRPRSETGTTSAISGKRSHRVDGV